MKEIAILLSQLYGFEKPSVVLEQYETDGNACFFLVREAVADIKGKVVVDLGCGTGRLTFASFFAGAKLTVGVEIDISALYIALENKKLLEENGFTIGNSVAFVCSDIRYFSVRKKFDTCIMNPPFGIKRKGADRIFLKKAFEITDGVIWVFLSHGSEPFVKKFAEENGFSLTHTLKTKIHIKQKFFFHRKKVEHLPVDLYRIERR